MGDRLIRKGELVIPALSRERRNNREINYELGINLSLKVKRQFLSPGNDDLL